MKGNTRRTAMGLKENYHNRKTQLETDKSERMKKAIDVNMPNWEEEVREACDGICASVSAISEWERKEEGINKGFFDRKVKKAYLFRDFVFRIELTDIQYSSPVKWNPNLYTNKGKRLIADIHAVEIIHRKLEEHIKREGILVADRRGRGLNQYVDTLSPWITDNDNTKKRNPYSSAKYNEYYIEIPMICFLD